MVVLVRRRAELPGAVTRLDVASAVGWARHDARADYPVTVSAILDNLVVASAIAQKLQAECGRDDGAPHADAKRRVWFTLEFEAQAMDHEALGKLRFIIGETDERLLPPRGAPAQPAADALLTLEEILAVNTPRPWVTGATHHEAEAAGLSVEDIIDLLYRDILGRHADPPGLLNYLQRLRTDSRTFDDVRHSLLESDEYRRRRINASEAPGAIFSQRLVLQSGRAGGTAASSRSSTSLSSTPQAEARRVRLRPMLSLSTEAFILRLYLEVMQKPIDAATLQSYIERVNGGMSPIEIGAEMQTEARLLGLGDISILELEEPFNPDLVMQNL